MARGIIYLAAIPLYAAQLRWQLHMLFSLHQVLHFIDGDVFKKVMRRLG